MCTYNLPWREERGEKTKTIWRNNLQSFLNLIKTINLQFKSSVKPKHRKHKENYARADHNKMLKTSDKKKVLKATKVKKKKKKTRDTQTEKHQSDSRFPVRKNATGKTVQRYVQSTEVGNKPTYLECYPQRKSVWKIVKDFFSPPGGSNWNAGDLGSIPGLGRPLGKGNGNPLQYSCLENSM